MVSVRVCELFLGGDLCFQVVIDAFGEYFRRWIGIFEDDDAGAFVGCE